MPRPRFTTLQLLLVTTLTGILVGLFMSAWQWGPHWVLVDVDDVAPSESHQQLRLTSEFGLIWQREIYAGMFPANVRIVPISAFISVLAMWSVVWGIVLKRGRESLAKKGIQETDSSPRQRVPTLHAP